MRLLGTSALLLALITLAGCGADGDDADDVPTITTRPSVSATLSTGPSESQQAPPTASASAIETSAPTVPATSATTTETETGPSPEPPTDEPGGPTTYAQASDRVEQVEATSAAPITTTRFSTPDDVVYCLLDDPVIGPSCELRTGFIKDADVCGGDIADGVGRIETYRGKPRPVCNTDTIREPGAQVVHPPAVVVVTGGGVECAVEAIGVTCLETGRHVGFFIGPREYHVF